MANPLLSFGRRAIARLEARGLSRLSSGELFGRIYALRLWGGRPGDDYYSGAGSHDPALVEPWVAAVRDFAEGFSPKLAAVDLGCGDFGIGARIRDCFGAYRAADAVPGLIARNRRLFPDADFQCLDIAEAPLPPGDVAILRQVLQHLSNDRIAAVVAKLAAYRFAIVTEHLPADPAFVPNRDMPSGADIRLGAGSGVVVTAPPFLLAARAERILCEAADPADPGALIRTTLYTLG